MVTAAEPRGGQVRSIKAPSGAGGPTVLRILLGAQLRRLREAKQITLGEAGEVIRASHSKMSRLETGRVGFKDRDVADLLTFYGVIDEEEREALRALARRANAPGWWHDYSDVLPSWFEAYVGLEEVATQIRAYQVQFVPGLFQTPDYTRAVALLGHGGAPDKEIDQRVALRMARQAVLTKEEPPNVWVVLDEAILRRPIGSPEVMRGQLKHLARGAAERDDPDHPVPGRRPRRGGRAVQHPALRRARPARRRLPRAAHQCAVPGQARDRGQLPDGDGAPVPGGHDPGRQPERHQDDHGRQLDDHGRQLGVSRRAAQR